MTFYEVKTFEWLDVHFINNGSCEVKIPQYLQMDSSFFLSEDEANKLYETKVKEFKQFYLDSGLCPFVPDGLEGGEGLYPCLSSGLEFEAGKRNFWLDTGDRHDGVILYQCTFMDDEDDSNN